MNDNKLAHFRITEDEIDVGHLCLNIKPIIPDRLILRNFDGSEAIIPADLLPEELRDGRQDVDAVKVVKHLVNRIGELEAQRDRLQDAAEFEARVAAKQATAICGQCDKFNSSEKGCPLAIFTRPGLDACRLKHARLAVEAEMAAEGK